MRRARSVLAATVTATALVALGADLVTSAVAAATAAYFAYPGAIR